MPNATITSTASTFGTISGTFAADQSTVTGTITAITGSVDGSVGVPGPQGPQGPQGIQGIQGDPGAPGAPGQGVAAGGSAGQVLQKLSSTSYDTGWLTLPADYITSVSSPLAVATGNLTVDLSAYLPVSGGTLDANSTIDASTATQAALFSGTGLDVLLTSNPLEKVTVNYSGLRVENAIGAMLVGPAGLTFPNSSVQTVAFPGFAGYATESWVTAGFYPLTGNPSGFLTSAPVTSVAGKVGVVTLDNTDISGLGSLAVVNDAPSDGSQYARKNGAWDVVSASAFITSVSSPLAVATGNLTVDLSAYLTSATAASTYAVIAAGQPVAGSTGQVLTKQSGTNYDSIWVTPVVGDRYLTSSTTSNTLSNGNKTFTIGTGLSYTPTQNITISYDASNHMHGEVLTYNSGTGVLTVDIKNHTGSGTYAAWVVNVGGVTPATSVAWGSITGTLSSQTDLQSALDLKLAATTAASTYQPLSGMSSYLTTSAAATTYATILEPSVDGILTVEPSGANSATLQVNQDANNYIHLRPSVGQIAMVYGGSLKFLFNDTYLQFPNGSQQTVAYPGSTGFLLKADNLSGLADTSVSRTNLGLGTMSTATAADYSTTTVANGLYYPLSGNPSAFLVAADITGKADLASPALTGNVTITSNSASAALTITQDGAGDILRLNDVSGDTTYTFIDAAGKVNTIASTTANAGLNVPHATAAPTSPVNGDIWTTTAGLFARINAGTQQLPALSTNNTFSNASSTYGSSTATGTINVASGATISASTKTVNVATGGVVGSTTLTTIGPVLGASTTSIGGTTAASTLNLATGATLTATTKAINIGTAGVTGSTTNIAIGSAAGGTSTTNLNGTTNFVGPITGAINNITLGNGTAASTYNLFTGATVSGSTKTVAIGTGGITGSTTNISIGSAAGGTSTTTLNGTTNGVTAAVDTNSVALATTAYVMGQGYLKSATASSTYAPLASPALTGTPTAPTATVGTNTTQIATTAFVLANASSGASWGSITGTLSSQTDLQGALDAKAPLASPSLTGTPLSTTAAADTNTTQIATTAYVIGQASSTTPANNGTAAVGTSAKYARADHVHATDTSRAPLASPTFTGTVTIPAGASISGFAPLASPSFTGTPSLPTGTTAVTQTAGNNTTAVATTAFVTTATSGLTNNVKAWVNFNGTGTVAIRASSNVSSITDNAAADYTVNFTTAISDANYCVQVTSNNVLGNNSAWYGGLHQHQTQAPTTTTVRVSNQAIGDFAYAHVTIFR